jgi:hypothetical protein
LSAKNKELEGRKKNLVGIPSFNIQQHSYDVEAERPDEESEYEDSDRGHFDFHSKRKILFVGFGTFC